MAVERVPLATIEKWAKHDPQIRAALPACKHAASSTGLVDLAAVELSPEVRAGMAMLLATSAVPRPLELQRPKKAKTNGSKKPHPRAQEKSDARALARGDTVRDSLSTGGMLGSLVGGRRLEARYRLHLEPAENATLKVRPGDQLLELFGISVAVRDAATGKPVCSYQSRSPDRELDFPLGGPSSPGGDFVVVIEPVKTSAYSRTDWLGRLQDKFEWRYLLDGEFTVELR